MTLRAVSSIAVLVVCFAVVCVDLAYHESWGMEVVQKFQTAKSKPLDGLMRLFTIWGTCALLVANANERHTWNE